MPRARLLVVREIGMKGPQDLAHPPCLADRHIVVGVAVEHVHAPGSEVSYQGQRVAGVPGTGEELLDRGCLVGPRHVQRTTSC